MIDDSEGLLRRIPSEWVQPDNALMSWAFRDAELSVNREQMRTAAAELADGWKTARLIAGRCRENGCRVDEDPLPDNPAHALVLQPPGLGKNAVARLSKALRDSAIWPAA